MRKITLLLMAIGGILAGCASHFPEPNVALDEARQKITRSTKLEPDSMRMITRVDYVDDLHNNRVVGQNLILSETKDGHMRITISAFDKAISTLVTDGTGFALIDVSQNIYLTGYATADNVAQILPVRLSAADLHRVIRGGYPIDNIDIEPDGDTGTATHTPPFEWDEKKGGYRLTLPLKTGGAQKVFYAWPHGDVFRIELCNAQDETTYIYEAQDFKNYESNGVNMRFPNTILFRLPKEKTDVRLRVEKRDLNLDFSPAVFELPPPQGAQIRTVGTAPGIQKKPPVNSGG